MTGSSAMTRRTSSRRTVWVSSNPAPAVANVPVNRPLISAEMAANRVASRRWAPPKSVAASTMPAQTMPMQISLARSTASRKACPFETADGAELVARDNRGGVTGQCRGIGREVAQECGDECACGAPQRQGHEKGGPRSCGKHAVITTIATAPTTVPIRRYQPLRNDAPRCG